MASSKAAEVLEDRLDAELTPIPVFRNPLIPVVDPNTGKPVSVKHLMELDKNRFDNDIDSELRGERIEMSNVPDIESLTKLFSYHVTSKGYYERAEELYRKYLSFLSYVNLSNQQAHEAYTQEFQKALLWVRENKAKTYASFKTADERNSFVRSYMPDALSNELFYWDAYLSQVKTNVQIIKSYRDQFKFASADSIAIQHRIINTLIEVGNLKIDPEVLRAMRMIESAYRPTYTDMREKSQADSPVPELDISEGTVSF